MRSDVVLASRAATSVGYGGIMMCSSKHWGPGDMANADWVKRLEGCDRFFALEGDRSPHRQVFAPFLCVMAVPEAVSSSHGALPTIPGALPRERHEWRRGAFFRC
jgi:hypothetical protein